jgi:hypothetical protein
MVRPVPSGANGVNGTESVGRKPADPRVVAENIIAEYGKDGLKKLITMFRSGESGTKIGYVFDVSRQRVHQWKTALGHEQTTYVIHSDIVDLIDLPKPRGTRRTVV